MKTVQISFAVAAFLTVLSSTAVTAQDDTYRRPDRTLEELVLAAPMPSYHFSHSCSKAAVGQMDCQFVPLSVLAGPEIRTGGIRFNPANNSESREKLFTHLWLKDIEKGDSIAISGLPPVLRVKDILWSPSDKYFCFVNCTDEQTELWRVDVQSPSPSAEKISSNKVNAIFGRPYSFIDDETVIYKSVPSDRGAEPSQSLPLGPVVQQNLGKKTAVRTYENLISSPYDELCYEYHCTSVFSIYSSGKTSTVGKKGIFRSYELSPDKRYIMVTVERRPFSYAQGHTHFPSSLEIWDIDGNLVRVVKDSENEKDNERKGFGWRADKPSSLVWTQTVKGIDDPDFKPEDKAGVKDDVKDDVKGDVKGYEKGAVKSGGKDKPGKIYVNRLYQCEAPFDPDSGRLILAPKYTLENVTWCDDGLALYTEYTAKNKFRRVMTFVPGDTMAAQRVIYTLSTEVDTVGDFPVYGRPCTVRNGYGRQVLKIDRKRRYIYFAGDSRGDSNKDRMEFIDRFDLKKNGFECLWMGSAPYREHIVRILDYESPRFLSRRESNVEAPNYHIVDVGRKVSSRQVTFDVDAAQLGKYVERSFVTYRRADGVVMTSNLYVPKGYDKERDGRLPVLIWAYPREYKCAASAEKIRPSRYDYMIPSQSSNGTNAVIWAAKGYAVLDGASMYIIAEGTDKEPNDVFLKNLVMDAEAAIDYIDSAGIGDRERVAVSGHSYGGFMTANLLAHTKLFKAGIARSGAYNRTLTPYGFQSEDRSYWKAKDVYDTMSPFTYADSIKTPIMLIHGIMDDNSGTFPIQSERLYQAIKGQGGTVRYIQLPYEAHGYRGIENILHVIYETGAWMEKYMSKEAAASSRKSSDKADEDTSGDSGH